MPGTQLDLTNGLAVAKPGYLGGGEPDSWEHSQADSISRRTQVESKDSRRSHSESPPRWNFAELSVRLLAIRRRRGRTWVRRRMWRRWFWRDGQGGISVGGSAVGTTLGGTDLTGSSVGCPGSGGTVGAALAAPLWFARFGRFGGGGSRVVNSGGGSGVTGFGI